MVDLVEPLGTERVGQLTGRRDPQGRQLGYALPLAPATGAEQTRWLRCRKCAVLFWTDDHRTGQRGRCRGGGVHDPDGPELALPHRDDVDTPHRLSQFRFCVKCAALCWTGGYLVAPGNDVCPAGDRHEPMGFDLALDFDLPAPHPPGTARTPCSPRLRPIDSPCTAVGRSGGAANRRLRARVQAGLLKRWSPRADRAAAETGRQVAQQLRVEFGDGRRRQRADAAHAAADLFPHEGYTSISATWQPGPRRWLLLYSDAHDADPAAFARPVRARIAVSPMHWRDATAVELFNAASAYGHSMHQPGRDDLDWRIPPVVRDGHQGWAYGAYLLDRYATWDEGSRELDLYYLLSLSVPYQVQLMHTKLRIVEA